MNYRYDGPLLKSGRPPSRKTAEVWRNEILRELEEYQELDECELHEIQAELNELNRLIQYYDRIKV